ncbi:NUDIX hydrolase [Methanothermobacter sp. THM-2]|uniref:NUDIX domain-containing protein n=1 Tax=Methanothermobacter sp. THM-2 TaxID=2606912 RepID=UPI0013655203|nr:NUDIX hydrolase [Methanothermobacter sp. THM-2]QHN07714.1 NUDIX hydrolase [Methanothermobacter sp. THM-2]
MRAPLLTVDVIIRLSEDTLVLVRRGKPPYEGSWAIPGGFVEYGETVEEAARREALEETGLEVELEGLLGVYSDPSRDPRGHTVSICFTAVASGRPVGGSDAAEARVFHIEDIPYDNLAFDHSRILDDFIKSIRNQDGVN